MKTRMTFSFAVPALILLLASTAQAWGQTPQALFQAANQDYQNTEYSLAAEKYDSLLKMGYRSAELYNNLGNAQYRMGQVAPSILSYERAALLAPADEEITHNLATARLKTTDNIIPLGESLWERSITALSGWFSLSAWSILYVVFAWTALGLFALFLYSLKTSVKRWAFYTFLASLLLSLTSLGFRNHARESLYQNPYAIVTVSNITAKSEPSASGGDAFSIHEGTKVRMEETLNKWSKIRLADGKIGWVPSQTIETIASGL